MDDDSGWIEMTIGNNQHEVAYHPSTDKWRHRQWRGADFHSGDNFHVETEWFPGKPKT